jgi:hypothetical protein
MEDSILKHDAIRRAFEEVTLDMVRELLTKKLANQIYENGKRKHEDGNIDYQVAGICIARYCDIDIYKYYNKFMAGYIEEVLKRRFLLRAPDYYWVFDRYLGAIVWNECYQKIKVMLPPELYNAIDR